MDENIKKIIKELASRMNSSGVKWAFVGTVNHLLQGMNVNPNDIDIVISYNDLEKVKNVFLDIDFEIKEFPDKKAQEITFKLNGFEVQICADYEQGEYYKKRSEAGSIKMLNIDGIEVPVFTLNSEIECYLLKGRNEKANKLIEFIKN